MIFKNILRLRNFSRLATSCAALLALSLVACGGGNGGSTPALVSAPTLLSIAITPSTTTVAKGLTASLSATGTYSDLSTANLTSKVTWASSNTTVASINSTTGIVTSVAVGSTTIGASFNGITAPAANLSVTAAVITGLSITPATSTVAKGLPATFTATGTYSDGTTGNVSAAVTWASSSAVVATVNNSGIASSLAQGAASITASANGITSNAATLTVTAPALTAIAINPASATFAKGLTSSFTATGTYTDASAANITNQVTWVSANPAVATIGSTTGIATGAAIGNTTVSASLAGITAPAVGAAVTAAVVTAITVSSPTLIVAKGLPVTFTATGTYSDGTTGNISGAVTWVSSSPTVATLNTTGVAATLAQGLTSISSTFNGLTSNIVALNVMPPALVSIAITPTSASIPVNSGQSFSATNTYSDGSTIATPMPAAPCAGGVVTQSWVSSNTSVASLCSMGPFVGLSVGSTNITASMGGITSNAAVLTVTAIAPGGVAVGIPAGRGIMGGAIQQVVPTLTTAVSTLAGSGVSGFVDGTGTAALFSRPTGVTTDGTNLYVVDATNNVIRKVVIATGVVTTLAGSGLSGKVDATGTAASFASLGSITTDGTNLYVTEIYDVRKIVIATGVVTTLAGSGTTSGNQIDGTGTLATMSGGGSITTDGVNLYLTDLGKIRKIVIATGVVTTLAGSGAMATGITTDGANLYITAGNVIQKIVISSGVVTTIAGSGAVSAIDGTGLAASFVGPGSIITDGFNLYLIDNSFIRKMVLATGAVTTLAGGMSGSAVDATGLAATFWSPGGITTDGTALYVNDTLNNKIRKIQ